MEHTQHLENLLQEIKRACTGKDRKALSAVLREIALNRKAYYRESLAHNLQEGYGDALYKILLLELDKEEEDSIESAELAYIAMSAALERNEEQAAEAYKNRILLLYYFSDYFTDAVIEIFLAGYKKGFMLEARNIALELLQKMQLADSFNLEERDAEFMEQHPEMDDFCGNLSYMPDFSETDRKEAELMHKVLYAYLKVKYK